MIEAPEFQNSSEGYRRLSSSGDNLSNAQEGSPCKNKSLLLRNTATYVQNAAGSYMRLGVLDVLGLAGRASADARRAGERGGR